MDNLDGAIASLGTAINLNPSNAVAYGNRCIYLRRKKDIDGALADCSAAIRLDPGFTNAYTNRGQIFESKGDTTSAIADYAKAVQVPAKYDTGQASRDVAKARLAVLAPGGVPPQVTPPAQAAAASGGRLALVIGNGAYAPPDKLDNPPNDARAVAQALRGIGFEVIEGIDLDHAAMLRALTSFLFKASSARIALMYYAGHGVQIRGENYLVPTDAKLLSEATVELELINLDKQILDALSDEARANKFSMRAATILSPMSASAAGAGRGGLPYRPRAARWWPSRPTPTMWRRTARAPTAPIPRRCCSTSRTPISTCSRCCAVCRSRCGPRPTKSRTPILACRLSATCTLPAIPSRRR